MGCDPGLVVGAMSGHEVLRRRDHGVLVIRSDRPSGRDKFVSSGRRTRRRQSALGLMNTNVSGVLATNMLTSTQK